MYLKKFNKMIAKQDKLLYISFTILLNMAEDFTIEKKMKKRNIVTHLVRMLERNDFNLLLVSLLFLRKLSIISENKTAMVFTYNYIFQIDKNKLLFNTFQ